MKLSRRFYLWFFVKTWPNVKLPNFFLSFVSVCEFCLVTFLHFLRIIILKWLSSNFYFTTQLVLVISIIEKYQLRSHNVKKTCFIFQLIISMYSWVMWLLSVLLLFENYVGCSAGIMYCFTCLVQKVQKCLINWEQSLSFHYRKEAKSRTWPINTVWEYILVTTKYIYYIFCSLLIRPNLKK